MSLVPCPDCGKQVSDAAPTCPACGRPIANNQGRASRAEENKGKRRSCLGPGCLVLILLLAALYLAGQCAGNRPSKPQPAAPSESEMGTTPAPTPLEEARQRATKERRARLANAPETVTAEVGGRARLCPRPDCGEGTELRRIPAGAELEVEDVAMVRLPRWSVWWYQVTYEGTTGWMSEFSTSEAPLEPRYHK